MAGIIKITNGELQYNNKKSKNVTLMAKLICIFLLILWILDVAGFFICYSMLLAPHVDKMKEYYKSHGVDGLLIFDVFSILSSYLHFVHCWVYGQRTIDTFFGCFYIQINKCLLSSGKEYKTVFNILSIWLITLYALSSFEFWMKIVYITYAMLQVALAYGLILFLKKFCECKECSNLKDVKITYGDREVYTKEAATITGQILQEYFDIVLSNSDVIAIQNSEGEIIHKFIEPDTSVQLHAGDYSLKVFDTEKTLIPDDLVISMEEIQDKMD